MVQVIAVDLDAYGVVFPRDGVGMVAGQPFLELEPVEPFTCSPGSKDVQLANIRRTLEVALLNSHGAQKTHFTLFPECSIPGPDGIAVIDDALAEPRWPVGTVVMGGVDGLTKAQFTGLAESGSTHFDSDNNSLDRIQAHEWINCSVTWVKAQDGTVRRWLQPKINPAWVEINVPHQALFRGNSVYVFQGRRDGGAFYRFCSLICADWIGSDAGQKLWHRVMMGLAAQHQGELSFSWMFVLQYNPKPSHPSFLNEVVAFFDQTIVPNVFRGNACLVMVNAAGRKTPGVVTQYGATAVLFSQQTLFAPTDSSPTVSNGGQRYRKSTLLAACRDSFFREQGACVHSFFQANPASLQPGAAAKTPALSRAYVYPLGDYVGARAPSTLVPASIKWFNDQLDTTESLATRYNTAPLSPLAANAHDHNVQCLRGISSLIVESAVRLSSPASKKYADDWVDSEVNGVEHLLHTTAILKASNVLEAVNCHPTHGTILVNGKQTDLIAVRGQTHEQCIEYAKSQFTPGRRSVVVVTRDVDNTHWDKRFGSFLETPSTDIVERSITDPDGGVRHVGYAALLDAFRHSGTADQMKETIDVAING